jgi:hypothetical protein
MVNIVDTLKKFYNFIGLKRLINECLGTGRF